MRLSFIFKSKMKMFLMKTEISVPPLSKHFTKTLMLQKVHKDIVKTIHKLSGLI